jgi:MEDS: MEthanogen/methylotroph, DcmR Sensory domain
MDSISDRGNEQPIRFAGSELGGKRHICGFFNSADEEYRLLLPFIKEGFDRGERAFHVVDPKLREDHLLRLASVGIDVAQAEQGGQLELCDWEAAYFPDGCFDQNRMLAMWQKALEGAEQQGFPLTRLVAHMEWALEDREGVDDLLEYEARFNLLPRDKDPVICAYDLARFSGDVVIDIMRTHPMIIIGGILQENPFFVPPDEFLRELRQRRASRGGAHQSAS